MSELFPKPDYNPWETLSRVTRESDTARLQSFVETLDAIKALIYRGLAEKRVNFGDPITMDRLSGFFNQTFPGVDIPLETIRQFLVVHGEPDEYGAGVIGACTGITDRLEPSEGALADARRILDQL